ncbi:MAG: winged helix-turn-helix domain-containing protein [Acidimicrobiales bacterium]
MNVAIFWVSAIPIGYAVTGLYRMIHARRVGAVSPSAAYFVLGAFCFLVMIAAACLGTRWLGMGLSEIFERGMLPIVVITLPLVLLAHGHRSWALLSTVLVILGLAVAVDIYDLENLFGATDPAMAAVVPGLALVVSSLVLGVGPRFIRSWPPANAAQHRPIQTGRQAMTYSVQALDDTVHQRNRLAILSVLHELTTADFRFLRESLEMTDGNLGRHLVVLETAGFVNIAKGYEGKRPRTTVTITTLGRRALNSEIKALKEFVAQVEASPQKVRSRRGARPEGVIRTAQV